VSFLKPSQLYKKYLSETSLANGVNWLNNYSPDGKQILGAMHNIGAMGKITGSAYLTSNFDIHNTNFYGAGLLNYFLLDLSKSTQILTDIQKNDVLFFTEMRSPLDRINGKGNEFDFSTTTKNEPLIKQPIYFNVRYGIKTGSEGVIYPDMINWETLYTNGSNGININMVPTDRTIYCWDLTNNANPLFDFSATFEPLQFSDDRMYIESEA